MLPPGHIVERYVVEAVAGRGAMATVYRVRHSALGSIHALKVVESPGLVERFAREARAQARLRHPNVVAVTDFVDVEGLPGLVMEYVDGLPLDKLLARSPMLGPTIDKIFADVCAGVGAAHSLNMVHRDIKPANVLVAAVDGHPLAKVGDFGIVKVFGDRFGSPTLTRSQSGMGTPGYMAPEQMFDAKRVDQRADVFSLGCLLYRMWCGVAPFRGDIRSIFANMAQGRYAAPETLVPGLPERYAAAIRACLDPQLDRRPASVAALREALGSAAPSVPPAAASDDPQQPTFVITGKREGE